MTLSQLQSRQKRAKSNFLKMVQLKGSISFNAEYLFYETVVTALVAAPGGGCP
jgi:hypothetical protein